MQYVSGTFQAGTNDKHKKGKSVSAMLSDTNIPQRFSHVNVLDNAMYES